MIATVDRNALASAAKLASDTADPKSPQDLLKQALLRFTDEGLTVAATDLTTSVMTELPDPKVKRPVGSVCLDARRLAAAVASLPGGNVTVTADAETMRVALKSGKATVALAGRNGADFPTLPKVPAGYEVPAGPVAAAIGRCAYVRGLDELRFPGPYLSIKGERAELVAVTSHRIARAECGAPAFPKDQAAVTVPIGGADAIKNALGGAETARLAVAGGNLFVTAGAVSVAVKLSDANPLPWPMVIEHHTSRTKYVKLDLWREELLSAARRAGMMTGGSEKLANGINLALTETELTVASALDGTGEATTVIALDEGENARPEKLRLSWRYLADALGAIESEKIEFEYGTAMDPVIMRTPGSPEFHLVMVQSPEGR